MGTSSDTRLRARVVHTLLICTFLDYTLIAHALSPPQGQVTFGGGEKVWLHLDKAISSKTAQAGDRVQAEPDSPRMKKGTRVIGTVVAARAANKAQRIPASLKLVFRQIVFADGSTIPMEGSIEMSGSDTPYSSWKSRVLAAVLGMGGLGATIGAAVNGGKGAWMGAAAGFAFGLAAMVLPPRTKWKDMGIGEGGLFAVTLKQDVHIPVERLSKP